jgi:phosphotransferase system HPr (HPr) family protein
MVEFKSRVNNKIGMHLRAAGEFVKLANQFNSEVVVIKSDRRANGKSILGLASLAIGRGAEITIQIDGADEADARQALEDLIANNFNEE